MKISCNNLKKHIKNSETIDFLSIWDKFTIRCAEVENVEVKGKDIDGVVVGEIIQCLPHEKSKKLHILTVDVGKEKLQIVCGAPNAREHIKTAVVKVGGHVCGFEITPRDLVGVTSYGMCCSEEELGFAEKSEGIIELPKEFENGKDIKEYMPYLEDIIVEIDNKSLTNRPDLWGHYGIAREIAAITDHELLPLDLATIPTNNKDLDIKIDNPDLCFRYIGLKLGNITNNTTPLWMQVFLYYAGMRSISLIVDLTNYVMLELGQPMHAFDSRVVKNIEVGLAKDKDKFTTLDGIERNLTKNNLMIKNGKEYFAIAGVMGGLDSEILDDTTSIVLESASFDAASVRKTAISLGLRTEASARYEKSLDPNMCEIATKRFTYLLNEENKDLTFESNMTDNYPTKLVEKKVTLTKKKLARYMGMELDDKIVVKILESLGFKVKVLKEKYDVIVPTYRATKDIEIEEDLIEEIARIYGYENFEMIPLKLDLTFKEHENIFDKEYEVKKYLSTKYNLSEVHTYLWYKTSFLNDIGIDKKGVTLLSKADDNILRDDLSISLLEVAQNNLKQVSNLGIYELGTEIVGDDVKRVLSIVLADDEDNTESIYYKGKEMLTNIIYNFKHKEIVFKENNKCEEYFNKDYGLVGQIDNKSIVSINIVDNKVSKKIAKKKSIIVLKIDFDAFINLDKENLEYVSPSKYPKVTLDYTIIVGLDDKYKDIDLILNGFKSDIIKSRVLFDEYKDEYEKRYTIRYVVGLDDKTLETNDIQNFQDEFIKYVKANNIGIVE